MIFPHRARVLWHVFALFACAAIAVALPIVLDFSWPGLLDPVEFWTVDLRFRLRPPLAVSQNPSQEKSDTLVNIDYDDPAARGNGLGRWPRDRRLHVQVINWLREAGARAIVLDLLTIYPGRDPADDQALIMISRLAGNVIHPFAFRPVRERESSDAFRIAAPRHVLQAEVQGTGEIPGVGELILPLPGLIETAGGLGHILRTPDSDGVLRRTPLVYAVKGGFVPALSLAAAFRHMEEVDLASLRIERGQAIRFKTRRGEEIAIPIDRQGRAWINYAGPWGQRFLHYPYSWLFAQMQSANGKGQLQGWFKGRTVVVSNLETGTGDQGATPFDPVAPNGEVHLHILNMILTRQFLRDARPVETALSLGIPVLVLTASALLGGPGLVLPSFAIVFLSYLVTLQYAFNTTAVILPAVNPVLALTAGLILLLAARFFIVDRERLRFQAALGACLPPQTVQKIRQSPGRIPGLLAGRRRELTILFSDIQGFSSFCQRADPIEIQRVLREYLTTMTDILRAYGGTLDKYMGDGILAFFGDAEPEGGGDEAEEERVERQAANAARAALAMQKKMTELNAGWKSQGREPHFIRIGINTAPVTVGNLGTEYLWDYTVVGTEVNKAQRLQSAAEPGGMLLARRTYALAQRQGVLPHDLTAKAAELKGIGEEADLYPVSLELIARISVTPPLQSTKKRGRWLKERLLGGKMNR